MNAGRIWLNASSSVETSHAVYQLETIREGTCFARADNPKSLCRDLDHQYWDGVITPHQYDILEACGCTFIMNEDNYQYMNVPNFGPVIVCQSGMNHAYAWETTVTSLPDGYESVSRRPDTEPRFVRGVAAMWDGTPFTGQSIPGLAFTAREVGTFYDYYTRQEGLPKSQWNWHSGHLYGMKIRLNRDLSIPSSAIEQCLSFDSGKPPLWPIASNVIGDKLSDKVYEQMLSNPVNNLENLSHFGDVIKIAGLLKKLRSGDPAVYSALIKKGRSWGKVMKNLNHHNSRTKLLKELAGANLAYQYSVKTTLMDIDDSLKAMEKAIVKHNTAKCLYTKTNASTASSEVAYQGDLMCNTVYKSNMVVCNKAPRNGLLSNLGLSPTYSNLWDVVPFSFVVDWAIDFGHAFSVVDRQEYFYNNVEIAYSILTHKTIRTFTSPKFSGSISRTIYYRRGSLGPPLFVGHGRSGLSFTRVVNGISLIISGGKTPRS